MEGYIDLRKLSMEELAGVVSLYPWFGGARMELCRRMAAAGGDSWGKEQYADAAMYLPSRKKIAGILRGASRADCSDKELNDMLKKISRDLDRKTVRVAGGDYFSQEEYDLVRKQEDSVFSRFSADGDSRRQGSGMEAADSVFFYTETLAQIYADQGYYEQAKEIYSKLILAYPEKNAYFAALIEKLDKEIKK